MRWVLRWELCFYIFPAVILMIPMFWLFAKYQVELRISHFSCMRGFQPALLEMFNV
jgi:hypothetical protein